MTSPCAGCGGTHDRQSADPHVRTRPRGGVTCAGADAPIREGENSAGSRIERQQTLRWTRALAVRSSRHPLAHGIRLCGPSESVLGRTSEASSWFARDAHGPHDLDSRGDLGDRLGRRPGHDRVEAAAAASLGGWHPHPQVSTPHERTSPAAKDIAFAAAEMPRPTPHRAPPALA